MMSTFALVEIALENLHQLLFAYGEPGDADAGVKVRAQLLQHLLRVKP